MKKFTAIAAAILCATAFCGFCAACEKTPDNSGGGTGTENVGNTGNNGGSSGDNTQNNGGATITADSVIILVPGTTYVNGEKNNTLKADSNIVALTKAESEKYFVNNAYFCKLDKGAELPTPTSPNTSVVFDGWRQEATTVTVTQVPELQSTPIILYAMWKKK